MTTCNSILASGEPCAAPALNNFVNCRHHQPGHACNCNSSRPSQYKPLELPPLVSKHSILAAIVEVIHAISERRIKRSDGGTLIYGLQLASRLMTEIDEMGPDAEEEYDANPAPAIDSPESIEKLERRRQELRAAGDDSYVPTLEDMKGFMHRFECVNAGKLVARIAAKRDEWERQRATTLATPFAQSGDKEPEDGSKTQR